VPKKAIKSEDSDKSTLPRDDKDFEPSQDEKTAVKHWLDRVRRAEEEPRRKEWFELLEKLRGYVYGTEHKDPSGNKLTRTNLTFATIATLVPRIYAKNPDIAVAPTAAVGKDMLAMVKKFAATCESLLSQMLVKEAKLKKRMKSNVRSAMTTSYGVVKMLFQKSLSGDPLVIRRIQDTQENIAKIEALAADMKEGDDVQKLAIQRDELRGQLEGLRSGNEVKIFKGFVVDRMRSEDFLILDDSIAEFDEYVDAAALGHVVWMTVDDYKAKFKHEPKAATKYNTPFAKAEGQEKDGQGLGDMFVCVIEIWDKSAGVIRTVAKGSNRWCREPYAPKNTPQRWYPFYVLGFNLVEGRWRPNSDVELLMNLQDEYNTTRTNFADARKDSVPIRVFRKGGSLTEEDIKALSVARRNRDWIGVEGNPSVKINDDIMQLDGPKIDPQAYDVTLIRNDMDMMAGLSDASRANLIQAKTATEAEIMRDSLGLRVDERRDTNEDLMSEMAEAALEIALRDMSKEEVKQLAGEDAEWPSDLSVDQIFAMVNVSVRAGSSGKPNADKDREQWTKLLPEIKGSMETVSKLRETGHFDMADAMIELLRETLRRFQEKLDVDSLIPPIEKDAEGKPVAQAQAMQQAAQLKQEVAELTEQLQGCQQELQKAQAGEQSKVAQINADKELAATKATAEGQARAAEANARAETEKHLVLVKAAVELLGKTMDNAKQLEQDGAGDEAGTKATLQMNEVLANLGETMNGLRTTMEKIAAGTAPAGAQQ